MHDRDPQSQVLLKVKRGRDCNHLGAVGTAVAVKGRSAAGANIPPLRVFLVKKATYTLYCLILSVF